MESAEINMQNLIIITTNVGTPHIIFLGIININI